MATVFNLDKKIWAIRVALNSCKSSIAAEAKCIFYWLVQKSTRDPNRRLTLLQKKLWLKGISDERMYQTNYHLQDPEAFGWQVEAQDPHRRVDEPLILQHLANYSDTNIRIIDVGSGAITTFGYCYPGKSVEVIAVDPLADYYNLLLDQRKIKVPFPTIQGNGETLLSQFSPDTFDFAYARNSLDHCYDPLIVIRNMISLVKAGGYVLLRHYRNEGQRGDYEGLHQWNFDCRENHFTIWNDRIDYDVTRLLESTADTRCWIEFAADSDWADTVLVAIQKRNECRKLKV